MRSNLADVEVIYQYHTEKAVCVRAEEGSKDVWLPLSQVEVEGDKVRGKVITVTGPQSLFEEKELV